MHSDPEAQLLGMCLRSRVVLEDALSRGVTAEVFTGSHERVFVAMLEAEKAGRPVDVAHLQLALPDLAPFLVTLRSEASLIQNPGFFIDELLAASWHVRTARALSRLLRDFEVRAPFTHSEDERRRESLFRALQGLSESGVDPKTGPRALSEILEASLPQIEQRILDSRSGKVSEIPSGITALDSITSGGFRRGSVNVFAARTGLGKTTLALNLLFNAAQAGFGGCYFTVEMPAPQLVGKLLSRVSGVKGSAVFSGNLSETEIDRVWAAARSLYSVPLWVDDNFRGSFEAFERSCRRLKRRGGLDVVVVDYVQQLSTATKHHSRYAMISEVSHKLKQLALDLEIAVISLAQFNREAEREDVPSVWQIKDSGAIEQDADLAVCLYRDGERYLLKVDKNRWGKDRVQFVIDADLARNLFQDAAINFPEAT